MHILLKRSIEYGGREMNNQIGSYLHQTGRTTNALEFARACVKARHQVMFVCINERQLMQIEKDKLNEGINLCGLHSGRFDMERLIYRGFNGILVIDPSVIEQHFRPHFEALHRFDNLDMIKESIERMNSSRKDTK